MRYLSLPEVLEIHARVLYASGGSAGLRDLAGLESAVAQPRMSFGGTDLYPDLAAKAAALAHSLTCSHPFVDGNKRVGHACMEVFLILNGYELSASVDEQEELFLRLASGAVAREELAVWVRGHMAGK
jgi:death-on-curing protein